MRRKNVDKNGFQLMSLTLLSELLRINFGENLPILRNTQTCLQDIRRENLVSVKCTEEQQLVTNEESTIVSTLNLRFVGKAPATNPGPAGHIPQNVKSLLMNRLVIYCLSTIFYSLS